MMTLWQPTRALAQDTTAAVPQAGTRGTGGLEEIIVTARRREERLQDVPVAATALTSEDLARYQIQSFYDIAQNVPELQIGTTGSLTAETINLRGIGAASSGVTLDQAVAVNIDGIQFSQANVIRLGLYDLSRVEVLKGPQTLFYGKSSEGGIISIVSQDPGNQFETKARVGYEFENQREFAELALSSPITPSLGARLDVYYENQSGWFKNDAEPIPSVVIPASLGGGTTVVGDPASSTTGPDDNTLHLRGTLAYKSADGALDAKLKMTYGRIHQANGLDASNQIVQCVGGAPQYVLALTSAGSRDCKLDRAFNELNLPASVAGTNPMFGNGAPYFTDNLFLTSLDVDYRPIEKITLSSLTGYYDLKEDLVGNFSEGDQVYIAQANAAQFQQFSEEVRALSSFDFPLNFMVGAYYAHERIDSLSVATFSNPTTFLFSGGKFHGTQLETNVAQAQLGESYSEFGQVIFDITGKLNLSVGGRLSQEIKSAYANSAPTVFFPAAIAIPLTPSEARFTDFSPDATLTFKPSRNLTLYAAFREGFKAGGFDLNSTVGGLGNAHPGNVVFHDETAKGGEVGAKGTVADSQFSFDLAIYDYQYTNLQITAFNPVTISYNVTNAGSATTKGVELATQFHPKEVSGFVARSALSYNEARFGTFQNSQCFTGQTPAQGCDLSATKDPTTGSILVTPTPPGKAANAQSLTGQTLPRAPLWTGNLGATYSHNISNNLVLSASADELFTGRFNPDPTLNPYAEQAAAWRLNANLSLSTSDNRYQLSLIGTNLTQVLRANDTYTLAGTGGRTGTPAAFRGDMMGTITDPRTITVQASGRF
jgi:iron complex outermembrane receptor protein